MLSKGGSTTMALLSFSPVSFSPVGGDRRRSWVSEEFAINLLNNVFERIAIERQQVLPVLAKVNSIYPPSCLSTNASV